MEPENKNIQQDLKQTQFSHLNKVTPVSKYLALALFVMLPFLGGWVGYTYAPEKVVEVEKVIEVSAVGEQNEINNTVGQLKVEEFSCGVDGETCFGLIDKNGLVLVDDLNNLYTDQAASLYNDHVNNPRVKLTKLVYVTKNNEVSYFFTGVSDSDACCGFVSFDVVNQEFSAVGDYFYGLTRSKISESGRFIVSAINDATELVVVDLEQGHIASKKIVGGNLIGSPCGFADDSLGEIIIDEDTSEIFYEVYTDTLIETCKYELLEKGILTF